MKTKIIALIILLFTVFEASAERKISIMCSIFPVYDFTRTIAGDKAEVRMLLRTGIDPHEFEPSPMDIKALNDSDVFVVTGTEIEHWAEDLKLNKINASENIEIINGDPHIWLDMKNAIEMSKNICDGLCRTDPENAEFYIKNYEKLRKELSELDEKFMNIKSDGKALVFAGEFSFGYFVRRYGIDYVSAYDGENEPSIKRMAETLKYINENGIKYVFSDYGEITSITKSISEQTGTEILILNSVHKSAMDKNFIEIMNENLTNIIKALK